MPDDMQQRQWVAAAAAGWCEPLLAMLPDGTTGSMLVPSSDNTRKHKKQATKPVAWDC
jgi:hypothetical protein